MWRGAEASAVMRRKDARKTIGWRAFGFEKQTVCMTSETIAAQANPPSATA
jgi:hypothetical protein